MNCKIWHYLRITKCKLLKIWPVVLICIWLENLSKYILKLWMKNTPYHRWWRLVDDRNWGSIQIYKLLGNFVDKSICRDQMEFWYGRGLWSWIMHTLTDPHPIRHTQLSKSYVVFLREYWWNWNSWRCRYLPILVLWSTWVTLLLVLTLHQVM